MGGLRVVTLLRLSRLPSCAVAFFVVFLPSYVRTRDLGQSLAVSVPMITISFCTFILNDLNDIERDRVNHPNRPLPAGLVTPHAAAIAYMIAFATSLALIQTLIEETSRYLYLAGFLLAINYNTIVDYFPKFKTAYVALVASLPVILVNYLIDTELDFKLLIAVFLFVLGRELLMDVRDLIGDHSTLVKSLSPKIITRLAFIAQALALVIFASIADTALEIASASMSLLLFGIITFVWGKEARRSALLQLMKLQMLSVITFLV